MDFAVNPIEQISSENGIAIPIKKAELPAVVMEPEAKKPLSSATFLIPKKETRKNTENNAKKAVLFEKISELAIKLPLSCTELLEHVNLQTYNQNGE